MVGEGERGEARGGVKEQVNGGAVQNTRRYGMYKKALRATGTIHGQSILNSTRLSWARLGTSVGAKPGLLDTSMYSLALLMSESEH